MLDVSIHIRDKHSLVREIARVLRPGGLLVMHDQIPIQAQVRAADGEYLGRVVRRHGRHFVIAKGFVFPRRYAVGYDQVAEAYGEAVWLLVVAVRERRELVPLLAGIAGIAAITGALVPFALDQRKGNHQGFIHHLPRGTRLEDFIRHPLAGELGGPVHGFVQAAALLALVAVVLLFTRAGARERRGALIALGVVVGSVVIPLAFTFTSFDYLLARNSLAIAVPMIVFVTAGLAAPRGGWIARAALAGLCLLWLAVDIAVPLDKKIQRDDWRGAVHALGTPSGPRVVVTVPYYFDEPLVVYLHHAQRLGPGGTTAGEIDLIRTRRGSGAARGPVAIPGFTAFAVKATPSYELDRYRAPSPVHVDAATLSGIKPSSVAFVQG